MGVRRQLVVGQTLLAGGLIAVAIGTTFPPLYSVVASVSLLIVPILVSTCGCAVIVVYLARSVEKATGARALFRIVGASALSGLGLALGFGAAGMLSQVPDSLAGLHGPYLAGSAPGIGELVLGAIGLAFGLVTGAVAALAWWLNRGQRLPPEPGERPNVAAGHEA